jgi:hypothetical protein
MRLGLQRPAGAEHAGGERRALDLNARSVLERKEP